MTSDNSLSPFSQIPTEIFDKIFHNLVDASDRFQLACTCEDIFRKSIEQGALGIRRQQEAYTDKYGPGSDEYYYHYYSILAWSIATHQDVGVVRRIVDVYLRVHPEGVVGVNDDDTDYNDPDLVSMAIEDDNLEVVKMLLTIDIASLGLSWKDLPFHLIDAIVSKNEAIGLWLVESGHRVTAKHRRSALEIFGEDSPLTSAIRSRLTMADG